jgi:hypothetical protein
MVGIVVSETCPVSKAFSLRSFGNIEVRLQFLLIRLIVAKHSDACGTGVHKKFHGKHRG